MCNAGALARVPSAETQFGESPIPFPGPTPQTSRSSLLRVGSPTPPDLRLSQLDIPTLHKPARSPQSNCHPEVPSLPLSVFFTPLARFAITGQHKHLPSDSK